MTTFPLTLLLDRDACWAEVKQAHPYRAIRQLLLFTLIGTAAYGSTLGIWHSPKMMLYTAIKFPLVVLGSSALVAALNWLLAQLQRSELSFAQVLALTLSAMSLMAWILIALLPIIVFFLATSAGRSGSTEEMQLAHNSVLLLHICCIAASGVVGVRSLWQGLQVVAAERCNHFVLLCGWLGSFAFVGCQLSWMLRPFIGSPFYPVVFFRPDALERNFYEFVLLEVLPFVLKNGGTL